MAQTIQPKAPTIVRCTVLRAICIAGERVEVGQPVDLTPSQAAELGTAGKVGPYVEPVDPAKPSKSKAPKAEE